MKYDLHVHSNISDGKLSREEIIKIALLHKLEYISFVEHNQFEELIINDDTLKKINGIEFDVFFDRSFHALCYFDKINNDILNLIKKYEENTNDRSEMLIQKIKNIYNIDISLDKLKQFFLKKTITKRDIIDWLIYNGYAKTVNEAANKFTNKKSPSYIPKYSLDFEEVSFKINQSGGKILLAHPNTLKLDKIELELLIKKLIEKGLDGIEIYNSSKMVNSDTILLKNIAEQYNLLTSSGSDFHSIDHILGVNNEYSNKLIKTLKK